MKQEPLSLNIVKTIMVVTTFVCLGALVGAIGYLITRSKSEPVVSSWKTYINPEANFIFKYPNNWEVKHEGLYKPAAGIEAKNRTVILGPIGDERSEIININVPQVATNYDPKACKYTELCGGNYIATCKKDAEILEVYHLIINSFQCIKDETAVEKYLHKDAVLYGVAMPPEAEYHAISLEEAILFIVQHLENKDVEDVKIYHVLWSVAPVGEFYIAGECNFNRGDNDYSKILVNITDGSGGEIGEPRFLFKGMDIWYSDPEPEIIYEPDPALPRYEQPDDELLGGYEAMAEFYNVSSIFKVVETQDETADWKTYRNKEYGLEIKYPKKWEVVFKKEAEHLFLLLKKENCTFSISEVAEDVFKEKENLIRIGCSSEKLIINGISFEKIICPEKLLVAKAVLGEYYFQKGNKYYYINFGDTSGFWEAKKEPLPPFFIKCEDIFNQILSTFKFIEK